MYRKKGTLDLVETELYWLDSTTFGQEVSFCAIICRMLNHRMTDTIAYNVSHYEFSTYISDVYRARQPDAMLSHINDTDGTVLTVVINST